MSIHDLVTSKQRVAQSDKMPESGSNLIKWQLLFVILETEPIPITLCKSSSCVRSAFKKRWRIGVTLNENCARARKYAIFVQSHPLFVIELFLR